MPMNCNTSSVPRSLRNAHFDNTKFVAVVMVVWGHISHYCCSEVRGPGSALTKARRFDMPLFCMVSGAMSGDTLNERDFERIVTRTVMPLVMFVFVLQPMMTLCHKHVFGFVDDPRLGFAWTYGDPLSAMLMIGRIDLAWYLRCLVPWRLGTPLLRIFGDRAQLAVIFAIGTASAYSYIDGTELLNLQVPVRTASLLPFFFIGQKLDWDRLAKTVPHSFRVSLVGWTMLLGFVLLYVVFEKTFDRVILSFEAYPTDFVTLRALLAPSCTEDVLFLWARYLMSVGFRTAMGLFTFLFCVPRLPTWFTFNGAYTMYPYLLHVGLVVAPLCRLILRNAVLPWCWHINTQPTLEQRLQGCLLVVGWLVAAIAIAYSLSSWPCRVAFRWAIEPTWVLQMLGVPNKQH